MNHQISCRTTSSRTNPTFMSSKHVNSCRTQFALRFIQALQRIKAATTTTTTTTTTTAKTLQQQQQQQRRTRLIKLASDASMASTVGARRVWSRAVLMKIKNRARFNGLEKKKKKKKKKRVTTIRASSQKKKKMIIKRRQNGNLSMIKRSDELRRLVPGGEGMDFCRLLGETAHYIECLNTQVQVMQSLVDAQKPSN